MGKLLKEAKLKKQLALKGEKTTAYDQIKQNEGVEEEFNVADLIQTLEDQGQQVDQVKSSFIRVSQKARLVNEPETKAAKELQERKVAGVVMKQDIKKWLPIIKKNRESEQLNFTKQKNVQNQKISDVSNILANNPIGNQIEKAMEEIKMAKVEQIVNAEENNSFQRKSHLQFYHDLKMKRMSSIKSKIYRKIKKRKSEKEKLKLIAQLTPAERRKEIEKLKFDRAKERVTLRHSTKNKFVSQLLRFGGDQKTMKQQQSLINNLKQQLIQKAQLNEEDVDFDDENFKEQAILELEKELQDIEQKQKEKSNSFGFLDRQKRQDLSQSKSMAEKLLTMLRQGNENNLDVEEEEVQEDEDQHSSNQNNNPVMQLEDKDEFQGRAKFNQTSKIANIKGQDQKHKIDAHTSLNIVADKDNKNTNNKTDQPQKSEKQLLIEGLNIKNLKQKYEKINDKKLTINDIQQLKKDDDNLIANNLSNFNLALDENENEDAFINEKIKDLEEEIEPEQQIVKGWGSWAGFGIKDRKPISAEVLLQNKIKKIKEVQKKRQDTQLDNVILSQKRDTKFSSKFQVQQMPFEFQNADQFDQTNNQIIGPEWNSLTAHQNLVKQKVITKSGIVITPVKVPQTIQKLVN